MKKRLPKSDEPLKETLDVLSDPVLMHQINASKAFYESGKKGLSFDKVFGKPLFRRKSRRR
jgi:hypothetical protein